MSAAFDLFISDLFHLYNRLLTAPLGKRDWVIASGHRALSVLRAYRPEGEGEDILIETAVEQFEELVIKAGGQP